MRERDSDTACDNERHVTTERVTCRDLSLIIQYTEQFLLLTPTELPLSGQLNCVCSLFSTSDHYVGGFYNLT